MALKKVTRKINRRTVLLRKIISSRGRSSLPKKADQFQPEEPEKVSAEVHPMPTRSRRECFFCQKKSDPTYLDLVSLRRFLTDRAKIVGRERSGVCARHQRAVTKNIKYARHLALLPFVPKV